jgi:TPR repeat protein
MSYFNEHIGAAENGNPNSQFQVANAYYNGEGVFKDHGLAVKWWRKAAEQGHILAQRDLAHAYSLGKGVAIDKTEAAKWYLRAADQGDRSAQFQIGLALFDGIGIAKNTDLSIEYLRKAALAGHKGALQFLNNCARHLTSLGLTPDSRFNLPQKTGCLLYIIGSGMLGLLFLVVCL